MRNNGKNGRFVEKTQDQAIEEFKKVHHDKNYDYSKVIYTGVTDNKKIIIICPNHGEFSMNPSNHLRGKICLQCSIDARTKTTAKFIEEAKKVHKDEFGNPIYDYSLSEYNGAREKIKIICKVHGEFEQITGKHLSGARCEKCAGNVKYTTVEYVEKAKAAHSFRSTEYDYSKVNYNGLTNKIEIICKIHGSWKVTASNHLNHLRGCPKCSHTTSKVEMKWLDFMKIPNDSEHRQVIKYINGKKFILDGFDPITKTVYEFYGDIWHGNPKIYKSDDFNKVCKKTFGELYKRTIQKETLLIAAGYKIESIWESDWKNMNK